MKKSFLLFITLLTSILVIPQYSESDSIIPMGLNINLTENFENFIFDRNEQVRLPEQSKGTVTLNFHCPGGESPDSIIVTLDGPGYFDLQASNTGTVVFTDVPSGYYEMIVTISGDMTGTYSNFPIFGDETIELYFEYEFPLSENFTIYSFTSTASWESPEGNETEPWQYNLFLNDSLVAEVPGNEFSYFYDCLIYGQEYTAGVQAVYDCGESDTAYYNFASSFLYPPVDFSVNSFYGTDDIEFNYFPPVNCDGEVPDGLVSFNLYVDGMLIGNLVYEGQDPEEIISYVSTYHEPGIFEYCLTAIYDLSAYGFPDQTGESMTVCDTVEVIWGFELPFVENWNSGNFEFNDWSTISDNWVVDNDQGNEKPSVKYSSNKNATNYNVKLESTYFNAHELTEGNIWLDFHLTLEDIEADSTELMTVQVNDGNNWHTVYERANTGSFDWDSIHLDITPYSMSKVFQIAFEASGSNNQHIQNWLIDNIEIYRSCPSACDLAVDVDTVGNDQYILNFSWGPCDTLLPSGQWMQWDDGVNYTGMGTICPPTTAAVRWDANMLPEFEGYQISKLKFYFNEADIFYLKPMIWQGEGATNLIYSDSLDSDEIMVGWNTIEIDPPLTLDVTDELWIGYECNYPNGSFPHGIDAGPAVTGYGDMFKCGDDEWETLTGIAFDNNFNLAIYVVDTLGREFQIKKEKQNSTQGCSGFNLYRSVDGGEYEYIYFLPFTEEWINYPYTGDGTEHLICYQLTAVYESETDYCESAPFTAKDNPEEDYVCVLLTNNEEDLEDTKDNITIFPNPATSEITIQSEELIVECHFINHLGQVVLLNETNDKQLQINTSTLDEGIYIVQLKTKKTIINKKLIIKK